MSDDLKQQCAQALDCKPEEIMMVKPYETHINVIFTNFSKTAVSNSVLPDPDAIAIPGDAPVLNEIYQTMLDNPTMYDRDQLRQLAAELRIASAATMNKRPLITAINLWKKENQ